MKTKHRIALIVALALMVMGFGAAAPLNMRTANAGLAPVDSLTDTGGPTPVLSTLADSRAITQTTRLTWPRSVVNYSLHDIQFVAVYSGSNPITLTAQYSNDGTNWIQGGTIAANTSGPGDMTRVVNYGALASVVISVTNSNRVTVTVKALSR